VNKKRRIFGSIVLCTVILLTTGWVQTLPVANRSKKEEIMTTEKNKAIDVAQIRQQLDNFAKAFRTRDMNLMMSLYAPAMVSFDIVPPLQDVGSDTYKKVWEKAFASFRGPIDIEMRDLNITTGDDVAFSHGLLRIHATKSNGQKIDYWERITFCFSKVAGKWLIVHEHVSVPVNLENGRAVLELKP
jgi:ketosteroid isomerase-like protein